jgi:AraC-like DNA-binding protein
MADAHLLDTDTTTDRKIIKLSDLGVRNALVIGKYQYSSARNSLGDHYHKNMMEICYCHKGTQFYTVNHKTYKIKGGDIFVTYPDEVHGTGIHPEEKGVLYWLLIHLPDNSRFFDFNKTDSAVFTKALINLPRRHFKASAAMKKALKDIMETADGDKNALQKFTIENLIISFLLQTIEAASDAIKAIKAVSAKAITIESFITGHYKETLTIKALASLVHLSESRFKSWFKDEFGMPPLEFILRLRIEDAKKTLQQKQRLSISTMAYHLGFSSPQHFATIFKRYTFLSPREFKLLSG